MHFPLDTIWCFDQNSGRFRVMFSLHCFILVCSSFSHLQTVILVLGINKRPKLSHFGTVVATFYDLVYSPPCEVQQAFREDFFPHKFVWFSLVWKYISFQSSKAFFSLLGSSLWATYRDCTLNFFFQLIWLTDPAITYGFKPAWSFGFMLISP